ncbi:MULTISPECIES: hypothetical protein [unclassified Streptomyces]|uniref:hypothetical protein n=1 Tax=unclassified Streptomyces TaxID=2593676 RepID=UPI00370FB650
MTTPARPTAPQAQDALVVPVRVDALAVNQAVRGGETFSRVTPNFSVKTPRTSPEPDFTAFSTTFATEAKSDGVYLQWSLPAAAVRGRADSTGLGGAPGRTQSADPAIIYPALPNRWLVVRYYHAAGSTTTADPVAAGWLLWSDHIDKTGGGSPFPDPDHPGASVKVATAHSLDAQGWKPAGGERFLRVTALGAGIPGFTVYQPYNLNILSFHDPLLDAAGTLLPDGTLSYLVAGWHQDPAEDLLAPAALRSLLSFRGEPVPSTATELLTAGLHALNWTVTGPPDPTTRTVYHGVVLGLPWQSDATFPSARPDPPSVVQYALGNSALDARTALPGHVNRAPRDQLLHRAFAQDCLDTLATALDDGSSTLDAAALATWFLPSQAGYRWQITDSAQDTGRKAPDKPDPAERARERDWLAALNANQHAYDTCLRDLAQAQTRLYDLWWSAGLPAAPPQFRQAAQGQLDPSTTGSLAAQVKALREKCFGEGGLRSRIPYGATTTALTQAVHAYAQPLRLPPNRRLTRVPLPPYYRPADPLVLIDKAGTPRTAYPTIPTACRRPDQLIDHADTTPPPAGPQPGSGSPPPAPRHFADLAADMPWAPLPALLTEFSALESLTRAAYAKWSGPQHTPHDLVADAKELRWNPRTASGRPSLWPDPCELWRQAWSPLVVAWHARIHPLPYLDSPSAAAESTDPHWDFDGTRYHWRGTGELPSRELSGHGLLTDLPAFLLGGRTTQYLARRPHAPAHLLHALAQEARQEICQTLDGVNAALARRGPSNHWEKFDGPAAPLLDTRILAPSPPDPTASHFEPVRAAQLVLTRLTVIDRFGRSVKVLDSAHSPEPLLAASVTPDTSPQHQPLTVKDEDAKHCVQLTPRLQQVARTRFDTVSSRHDDTVVEPDDDLAKDDPGPLCGWLVPNHRDDSLLVYGASGEPLGEVLTTSPDDAHDQVDWTPLPGSSWLTRTDVLSTAFAQAHPHLCGLLTALLSLDGPAPGWLNAYVELRGTIDEGLLHIAPSHHEDTPAWALAAGRPVALVRARLSIELAAPPLPAADWDQLLKGPGEHDGNRLRDIRWPIRLGDTTRPDDGLIGFFTADRDTPDQTQTNYRQLYTPYPPAGTALEYARGLDAATDPAVHAATAGTPPAPGDHTATWVTLLCDPWASVTATTAILPANTVRLPAACTDGPRARLTLCLRTGPLLAGITTGQEPGAPAPARALALPRPSPRYGDWAWAERTPPHSDTPSAWAFLPIDGPSTAIHPPDTTPDARTGHLTLSHPSTPARPGQGEP